LYLVRQRPILLHLFAETGCACGDYHEDVTGLIVRNPFRDRSAEKIGAEFLEGLRSGQCTADASVCRYALDDHRVSGWRLATRQDFSDRVLLFYRLTKFAAPDPKFRLTGEGMIEVRLAKGGWTVAGYSSYF